MSEIKKDGQTQENQEIGVISIRTYTDSIDGFKAISENENISQGETFKNIVDFYNKENNSKIKEIKLLIKIPYADKKNEDDTIKNIKFTGKKMFEINLRKCDSYQINCFIKNNHIKKYKEDTDEVIYAFSVYKTCKGKFLLYQIINTITSEDVVIEDLRFYTVKDTAKEIYNLLDEITFISETDALMYEIAEEEELDI